MDGSGMVAEFGRRRLGEIRRVGGEMGGIEPQESAVAQLECRFETGVQLEVGRWNQGYPGIPASAGDLKAKRLRSSRFLGARRRANQKSGEERGSHSASSPRIRRSHRS